MKQRKSYRQEIWVDVAGESIKAALLLSDRRSMRLQVTPDGELELRLPLQCRERDIQSFVTAHQQWITERLSASKDRQARSSKAVLLLGREVPFVASALNEFLVTDTHIWVPENWDDEQRDRALERWWRGHSRDHFERLIDHWWPRFEVYGVARPTLRVKRMRTRWGSLSKRGYINLNMSLLSLSEDLIELVVVHELCHLRHFDHGAGFRALMSECLPDWRQRDKRINLLSADVL